MATHKIKNGLFSVLILLLISACSSNTGRYQQKHDSTPTRLPSSGELHDATPRAEAHSRGGNKNYQVRGKHYQVLKSAENFTQTGIASWYGRKFHGHLTSNGEIYDMYAMSAAHKNLPLPTYLKVVNNQNGRSVIVRANDRGPFHQDRIIDLSYSAAYKLDMLKTGTANVTITAITDFSVNALSKLQPKKSQLKKITPLTKAAAIPVAVTTKNTATMLNDNTTAAIEKTVINKNHPTELSIAPVDNNAGYIQVFASNSESQANKLANVIAALHQQNTQLEKINGIYRVLVGPIKQREELASLLLAIKDNGYPKAFVRKTSQ